MLLKLSVTNFGILSDLELDLSQGMTVISGESGAGKSMVIEAIHYLYGKRASTDDIRYDTDGSVIEGVFDFPHTERLHTLLSEYQIEEDELYIVRREIMQNKKSIIKINNRLITLNSLKSIMAEVLSIYAQSSHSEALDVSKHIEYLDRFIDLKDEDAYKTYQQYYNDYKYLSDKIKDLEYKDRNRLQSLELYRHQYDELSAMKLVEDEEQTLEEELDYLSNYEKVHDTLALMQSILGSEYSPQSMLYELNTHIEQLSNFDHSYEAFSPEIMNVFHLLNELDHKVTSEASSIEFDEARLNDIQSRLNAVNHLKRKYNRTFEGLIELESELESDIDELDNINESFTNLQTERDDIFNKMEAYAKELHKIRNERKHFLENRIKKELQELELSDADFEIRTKEEGFNRRGFSQVQFYISTNRGEPLKEMNSVASGGEMARVMLALKTIFIEFDAQSLLILDEIDTGVSGKAATRMAEKMKLLSRARQVLVISHLPQATSASDHHLHVTKEDVDGRTIATSRYLNDDAHIDEIARLLSGSNITGAAKENAQNLIESFT